MAARGRRGSRRLALQALYQYQIAGHAPGELRDQFSTRPGFAGSDRDYFAVLVDEVIDARTELDELIGRWADRPLEQLDPIERAVLWIGLAELRWHDDVPSKVVINEAVDLAKEFGAQDSYRYINGILDRAAAATRDA